MHSITVDAVIPADNTKGFVTVRKKWKLDESPFWNSEFPPGKAAQINYPILPYPGVRRAEFPLSKKLNFSFRSTDFCERASPSAFCKEIFVTVEVTGIGCHDAPDEEHRANPSHLELFLTNGWDLYDPDEDE